MGNSYSASEYMKTAVSLVLTKVVFPKARLIRRPIYIRGRKSMSGCVGLTTGRFCRFDLEGSKPTLYIGDNCEMGELTHIVARENVHIGNNVLIASKCFISDTNHGVYKGEEQSSPETPPNSRPLVTAPVSIGNNAWIGENVVILAGSKIGDGCVIGANSVVSGEIESGCMAVGAPARIVKRFDPESKKWIKTK